MQIKKYFADHFSICEALTPAQIDETFRVRHAVYCDEFEYLSKHSDGRERDAYDSQSYHCLVRDQVSKNHIGCMRLIQARQSLNDGTLPVFSQCAEAFDKRLFDFTQYEPHQLGEVSRLAVINSHRMRNADRRKPVPSEPGQPEQRTRKNRRQHSVVPLSLFLGGMVLFKKMDAEIVVAMMEPSLGRMLRMSGICFEPVGKIVDYHGPRAPFILRKSLMFKELSEDMLGLFEHVEREMSSSAAADQDQDVGFEKLLRVSR